MNPLLSPSELPYRLPEFDAVGVGHLLPAVEAAMAAHLAEIDAIVADPAPPTFDNTVAALERSGRDLHRAITVFFTLAGSCADDEIRDLEKDVTPRYTRHSDAVALNRALWQRISRVETDDPEEAWLLRRYRTDFVKAGAELAEPDQARLRRLNEQIAALATEFAQNLVAAVHESALKLDDPAALDGLDAETIAALEHEGSYTLALRNTTDQAALAQLTDPATRRALFRLSTERAPQNGALAAELARLRAERAVLLGFQNHAAYVVADQTAQTVDAVEDLLGRLVEPAVRNVGREAAELREFAAANGHEGPLEPWDWAFYAERLRTARYDLDTAALRPYFELDRVIADGVFFAASKLFGIGFTQRPDLRGYHPDTRVWEVFDADGSGLGLFVLDPYSRAGKRGGAWMHNLVEQSYLLDEKPVVVNNLNLAKPATGPTLLTFDEVITAFHEFGHALHGLFSAVRFPRVEGTSVPRDFVEYPSQANEMWAAWPEVLANYARHVDTGEPLPARRIAEIRAAQQFNQGFKTLEYLAATLLDWSWHTIGPDAAVTDADAFEAQALAERGVAVELVPPRYRSRYFAHIFSDLIGYSAGYYSYIWSEVLAADTIAWFTENGMNRHCGDHYRRTLLSVGGSVDPMDAFRAFRGRDPDIAPLLAHRGLA
ncbi:MAG: M3 family metallopeptidase [Mycobacteriaceae bacterium]|nr:M3 family metallopeptidase [Mycobacteriaceae bacterium]